MTGMPLYVLSMCAVVVLIALVAYVIIGKRRQKENPNRYQWQPEQDYDLVVRGESAMSPGFPTLVARNKSVKDRKAADTGNSDHTSLD